MFMDMDMFILDLMLFQCDTDRTLKLFLLPIFSLATRLLSNPILPQQISTSHIFSTAPQCHQTAAIRKVMGETSRAIHGSCDKAIDQLRMAHSRQWCLAQCSHSVKGFTQFAWNPKLSMQAIPHPTDSHAKS